jgi:SNF2 family DNA or RNA helicase
VAELRRWCPQLRVLRCHTSDPDERARRCAELRVCATFDVALTTYEMLKASQFATALQRCRWDVLVLDVRARRARAPRSRAHAPPPPPQEGHRVKNEFSQQAAAVRALRRSCCLLLTGTLLQNNLHEARRRAAAALHASPRLSRALCAARSCGAC